MTEVRLRKDGRLTLPHGVRERLGLRAGDTLEIVVSDGVIVLHPKQLDDNQAYYWSETWQAGERQASEEISQGRTLRFASAEDAVAYLKEQTSSRRNA